MTNREAIEIAGMKGFMTLYNMGIQEGIERYHAAVEQNVMINVVDITVNDEIERMLKEAVKE